MGKYVFLEGEQTEGGDGPGLPIAASDVTYAISSDPSLSTVKEALDKLLYVSPSVSLSGGGTYEIGSTVHGVHLTWGFNKPIVSQSLNQGIGALPLDQRSYDWPADVSSNITFTLTTSDGKTTTTGSTSVQFSRKRYWGVSAALSLDNAEILALSQEFSSSRAKSITYDCSGGRYPYFCYPKSLGALSAVSVGGLAFSDFRQDTVSLTNASGHTEDYYVTRFNGIQTGANIVVSWS